MEGDVKLKEQKKSRGAARPDAFLSVPKAPAIDHLSVHNPDAWRRRQTYNTILIVVIGVGGTLIAGLSFYSKLTNPFAFLLTPQADSGIAQASTQDDYLKSADTDHDGLSDYLELNVYHTSPYLADSNSDGVSDGDSVKQGINPNCIPGQTCSADAGALTDAASTDSTGITAAFDPNAGTAAADAASPLQPGQPITAQSIRALMRQNGVDEATLNQMTDDELISQFNSYLQSNPDVASQMSQYGITVAATQPSTASASSTSPLQLDLKQKGISSMSDLTALSGAQIRQLMVEAGATADVLSKFSDDQLRAMFTSQLGRNLNQSSSTATST